jgi:sugar/nucleoside kinase (ribokinase family)
MIDICCIGHITHDRIITPGTDVHIPGGASYYFTHGISHLLDGNVSYKLITSLAEEDMQAVREIEALGIPAEVIPSRHTVYFENIYETDMNHRRQRVLAKADPFTVEALKDVKARYIVLGSLLADDFSLDVIRYLSGRGTLVVDAQGYLREVRDQKVFAVDWPDKLEALRYIDILKVNEYEAAVLTGEKDLRKSVRRLAEWGPREVLLTMGDQGSLVYAQGLFYEIPAYAPSRVADTTGCGDTYVMGYLFRRCQGAGIPAAAHFAAAVSSLKLEHTGPFCGTAEEALSLIPESLRICP